VQVRHNAAESSSTGSSSSSSIPPDNTLSIRAHTHGRKPTRILLDLHQLQTLLFYPFSNPIFIFINPTAAATPPLQKSTDIPRYESTNHCSVVSAKQSSYPGQLQLEAPEKPGDGRTDGSQRDAGRLRPKPPRPAASKEDRQLDGRLPLLFDLNWLALGGKHGA
jgi:hypothetical protein